MIPDFVLQTQEIQRQLESQIEVTMQKWQDSVAERFSKQYLEEYSTSINKYIIGGNTPFRVNKCYHMERFW